MIFKKNLQTNFMKLSGQKKLSETETKAHRDQISIAEIWKTFDKS